MLIYVSSYSKYDKHLLLAEPFHFIRKPLVARTVHEVLDRCRERIRYLKRDYIYSLARNGKEYIFDLGIVVYIESVHRVVKFHSVNGITQIYVKLDEVQEGISEICDFFLRPNKSFLINMHHVDSMARRKLIVRGLEISITSKYSSAFFLQCEQMV